MAKQIHDNNKFTDVRLPKSIWPLHYNLTLKPDLVNFTFEGTVTIQFDLKSSAKEVVLHANELVISEGSVNCCDKTQTLSKVTYSKSTETATLDFGEPLATGGVISLKFTGTLNDKLKGFYRSQFELDGKTAYAATTQFESTDARRCFPCWDEPAVKATFGVTITSEPEVEIGGTKYKQVTLSNMPCRSSKPNADGKTIDYVFDNTPKVSTYLLAFIVGPFEMIEASDGKRPIRVYTTPGKQEQGRFALEVACKSLPFYEQYFDIAYPLPKMDLIAIPDFQSGAMENWGLVTYRETALLVDPSNSSTATKQWVALVVAHELAHQWFGNLVTMEWWTHLWLNEGFASFMEYLCVDHIFPEYDIWSQFVSDDFLMALTLDALDSSHPIEVIVNHPLEVEQIFDAISYCKGASVIRMLYKYIGDDCFRKGMKEYLTQFAYKNAATEDLWEHLGRASNKPVCEMMSGWTSTKGFPCLSITATATEGKVKLSLTQSKFTSDGKVPADESNVTWFIPISALSSAEPKKVIDVGLLKDRSAEYIIDAPGNGWVKLNPGTVSLYRAAYSAEMLDRLLPAIKERVLPPSDRLGIQSDYFALCQSGKIATVDLLKLLSAFKHENDYTVWSSIDACMGRLSTLFSDESLREKFQAFGRELYSDIFKRVTWMPSGDEKHTEAMLRALVINRLIALNDKSIVDEAKRKFKSHLDGTDIIPADLRGAVYRAVASHGDSSEFESLFTVYRKSELHEEKNRALKALGFAQDDMRLKKVTDLIISTEVRNQDKVFGFYSLGTTNPALAWKVFKDNKVMFKQIYESGHLMNRLVKFCTVNFVTAEMAQTIAKYFQDNEFPSTERTVQQSLETIRVNAAWLGRDAAAVRAFLA